MLSQHVFITSQGRLMLSSPIFRTSLRGFMLSKLTKKESTASGNGDVVSPIFG
jgi:hypothetical protein